MQKQERMEKVVKPLVEWYQKNRRILPWREGKNPYHIWISEIMLQQTKIEAVKKYYERFIQEIPTIQDLAKIEEEKLLKLWEGLGYYNRARNMRKAAIIIEEKYQSQMPKTYKELVELPGIGEYTAGAIASICYDEKVPAVDGNVLRVIARITASKEDVLLANTKKEASKLLTQIMPKKAGDFNEGLMELGEVICIPNGMPFCERCPIQEWCLARKEGLVLEIPVREKKVKRKKEKRTVYLLKYKDKIAIQKRSNKGLLANMYEFPNELGEITKQELEEKFSSEPIKIVSIEEIQSYNHVFSHIEWSMKAYVIEVEKMLENYLWVTKKQMQEKYPLPGAFMPFWEQIKEKME